MHKFRAVPLLFAVAVATLATSVSVGETVSAAAPTSQLQFEAIRSYGSSIVSHLPDVGDFNNDGRPELISSLQNADGTFTTFDPSSAIGLQSVDAQPVINPVKTFRIADFNGDGFDDILQVPYAACSSDPRYKARIFLNDHHGKFVEDPGFSAISRLRGRAETALAVDFNNDGKIDIFIPFCNRPDDPDVCSGVPGEDPFTPTSRLLRNDSVNGSLLFTDVTPGSGVVHPSNELGADKQPVGPHEGAQSADVNGDGLLDSLAGQRLYINRGNFRFED